MFQHFGPNQGGVHEVAKWVPILGEILNLTASFDHQRAAKIVCPLVVKNLLSDSDLPPEKEPIFLAMKLPLFSPSNLLAK